jgi:CopG family transcriptional regulator, nickel-responsive regulator
MAELKRFGVSVEEDLIERFDRLIKKRGYANRCEALRDLMREALIEEAWETNAETVGTVTLLYDHHDPGLGQRLTDIQHDYHEVVISGVHSHLNHHDCLEVIILKGKAQTIKALADKLISTKGVKHGRLVRSGSGTAAEGRR